MRLHVHVYRILDQVPKVSTIEGFHCIQDTSPGPQGVHNRGIPLYTGYFTGPQGVHNRGVPLYYTRHQPCVSWKYGRRGFLRMASRNVALSGISPSSSCTTTANLLAVCLNPMAECWGALRMACRQEGRTGHKPVRPWNHNGLIHGNVHTYM